MAFRAMERRGIHWRAGDEDLPLVMNHTGATQRFVWLGGSDGWGLFWYTPKAQCDGFSLCGSYGVCSIDTSPMCHCFQVLSPESISGHTKKKGRIVLPLTVSIVSGLLVIMAFISMCIWTVKKRRRKGLMTSTGIVTHSNDNKNDSLELPFFHFDAVITATNNFAEENILGEGGFGPVYKGKLEEGQEIAVKRLSKTSVQGIDEFKNELMLIKLQHRNLVRLLGFTPFMGRKGC
ncbi:hypothetical protein J5N97_011773 [Dioscorea zingiberensis]|uniref:Protein kinase domain-containing protein n=1 Tax=Dioscorea zingiberensis TaxID=325984 RepID=A0A9D5D1Q9_9LILI|nr:hypothetical protein J5N97_011773 [Dioscorea zingiberensis]